MKDKSSNLEYKKIDISKIAFYCSIAVAIIFLSFGYGLYSGVNENGLFKAILNIKKQIKLVLTESSNLVRPIHFLQPANYTGSGVTINKQTANQTDLVFLSGFFDGNNELRLISKSGDIINRWPVKFSEIFPTPNASQLNPSTDWNIDIHGAVALQDGSIVFNFEYGGIVKLNRCGKKLWSIPTQSHHSIEVSEKGGFWVPGRIISSGNNPSPYPPFAGLLKEDTIMKVTADGKIEKELSVAKLLYNNGFESLLTSTGEVFKSNKQWDHEIVHLNKITELKSNIANDFPLFNTGDLLLSLRTYNMLLVLDPETLQIKWFKVGPWKRQHDPEFKAGGKITVFNNNIYLNSYFKGKIKSNTPQISNIIEIDPVTNKHEVIYGGTENQKLLSIVRGKHEMKHNNGILITEFESGRALEVDSKGNIVWQYINRYSEKEVAELTEARSYPKSYFKVADWNCNTNIIN